MNVTMTTPDPLALLRSHPALMQRIAFATFDFDVVSSDRNHPISVRPGRVDLRTDGGQADFTIRAMDQVWAEFAKAQPRPGYNDVVALIESGHAQLDGNALSFFRHLFFVKGVVAAIFKGDARP
jgi:hypothetical protein